MLTLRSLSLTFLGLLSGFAAAAQSPAATAGPTPTTVLSWVVWWAAGVVLLMAIITAGSVTSAARHRLGAQPEPQAPAAEAATASPAVASQKAPVQTAIEEEVYA
ncbi:hypothetical protein [Hymenobacter daeguensis]